MIENLYYKYESKWGGMVASISREGILKGLWFEGQKYYPEIKKEDLETPQDHIVGEKVRKTREALFEQLKKYENGLLSSFEIPLDPDGTRFQKAVWNILLSIPYGKTMTYGEIGQEIALLFNKDKMSAQAVGQAVGHNPISIVIPCHRVVGKSGQLTGYAGGLPIKQALLTIESGK